MSINQELKQDFPGRVSLIVFLKNIRDQYKLRRYGNIVYFSKKIHYCVLYVNEKEAKKLAAELEKMSFVKKAMLSAADQIDLDPEHIQEQIEQMARAAEDKLAQDKEHNE